MENIAKSIAVIGVYLGSILALFLILIAFVGRFWESSVTTIALDTSSWWSAIQADASRDKTAADASRDKTAADASRDKTAADLIRFNDAEKFVLDTINTHYLKEKAAKAAVDAANYANAAQNITQYTDLEAKLKILADLSIEEDQLKTTITNTLTEMGAIDKRRTDEFMRTLEVLNEIYETTLTNRIIDDPTTTERGFVYADAWTPATYNDTTGLRLPTYAEICPAGAGRPPANLKYYYNDATKDYWAPYALSPISAATDNAWVNVSGVPGNVCKTFENVYPVVSGTGATATTSPGPPPVWGASPTNATEAERAATAASNWDAKVRFYAVNPARPVFVRDTPDDFSWKEADGTAKFSGYRLPTKAELFPYADKTIPIDTQFLTAGKISMVPISDGSRRGNWVYMGDNGIQEHASLIGKTITELNPTITDDELLSMNNNLTNAAGTDRKLYIVKLTS